MSAKSNGVLSWSARFAEECHVDMPQSIGILREKDIRGPKVCFPAEEIGDYDCTVIHEAEYLVLAHLIQKLVSADGLW